MKKEKLIELLKDDDYYYRGDGKKLLSVSHIDLINRTPELYIKFRNGEYEPETTTPMVFGGALHVLLFEKYSKFLDGYQVVNAATRNTNIYKKTEGDGRLLVNEYEQLVDIIKVISTKAEYNGDISDMLSNFIYHTEVPNIIQIHGVNWKGKADIVTDTHVYDLKTTANIKKFKWSAYDYYYNAQAWLYSKMFNKPVKFIIVDKETLEVGIFDCSENFLNSGRDVVEETSLFYRDIIEPTMLGKEDKVKGLVKYVTL